MKLSSLERLILPKTQKPSTEVYVYILYIHKIYIIDGVLDGVNIWLQLETLCMPPLTDVEQGSRVTSTSSWSTATWAL